MEECDSTSSKVPGGRGASYSPMVRVAACSLCPHLLGPSNSSACGDGLGLDLSLPHWGAFLVPTVLLLGPVSLVPNPCEEVRLSLHFACFSQQIGVVGCGLGAHGCAIPWCSGFAVLILLWLILFVLVPSVLYSALANKCFLPVHPCS